MADKQLLKLQHRVCNIQPQALQCVQKKIITITESEILLHWDGLGISFNLLSLMSNVPLIFGVQFYITLFAVTLFFLGCKSIEIQEIKNDAKMVLETPNLAH
jgi:hypothetical protein